MPKCAYAAWRRELARADTSRARLLEGASRISMSDTPSSASHPWHAEAGLDAAPRAADGDFDRVRKHFGLPPPAPMPLIKRARRWFSELCR